MTRILSEEDIQDIRDDIERIGKEIEEYQHKLLYVINSFDNQDIVQNFYTVGHFGDEQKERLIKIKEAVNTFYNLICKEGGLVQQTNEFLDNASSLNRTGTM